VPAVSLALAGTALGAYSSPKLVASSLTPAGSGGGVRIGVVISNADDATARVAIYIPNGYTVSATTAGAKLGTVTATAAAVDLGGAILPLTGELDAVDPNALTATRKNGIALCLAGQVATQTWVLHLTAAGQTVDLPMLLVPSVATEAAAGYQAKLVVCLPPPDVPSGAPGRAPFGAKLLSATFGVSAITAPASVGDARWTALFTPYSPGAGTLHEAATVESQSIRHAPARLTLTYNRKQVVSSKLAKGKRVRSVGTRVTYATTVTEAGAAARGPVTATAAGKKVGGARGSFTFTGASVALVARAELHKGASVPTGAARSNADLYYANLAAAACTKTPVFGGVPCVAATVGRATPRASVRVVGFS
jgi:hypothetical protein